MKVLITGGTGFLGKKLAYRLKEMGFNVTALGRNKHIGSELEKQGISFISSNLDDKKNIDICKNKDYVFHVGALSSPWGKYSEFYKSNVIGTHNIINGCEKHNVKRLIHVSTPSIYFNYKDRYDILENETLPEKFVNDYAKTKFMAEQLIDNAFEGGLPVITIRPRALFGPGDTTIIPRLIRVNEKGSIPLINNGNNLIDITYIENVVDALILCMTSNNSTLGKKYNITNGEPVFLIDLLNRLFEKLDQQLKIKPISFKIAYSIASLLELASKTILFGKEPILTRYVVGVLSKSQTLNISEAKKDLNYNPKVSINEGINLFTDWWRSEHK
jgi:nucleoside-diphosphate-sugar epimerase